MSSQAKLRLCSRALENKTEDYLGHFTCWASQGEDDAKSSGQRRGWKNRETQGRPDSSYSLQELLIFPQPMISADLRMRSSNLYIINHKSDRLLLDTILSTSMTYGFLGNHFVLGQTA